MLNSSLKGVFQGMMTVSAELMRGVVISTSPLRVKAENDEKLVLSDTLRLAAHLTKQEMKCSISLGKVEAVTEENEHSHEYTYSGYTRDTKTDSHSHKLRSFAVTDATITIDNSLKIGDVVYMLALNGNKVYFIIDKAV